jgi:LmbE family N-acetylglucosaminyl deacetylase
VPPATEPASGRSALAAGLCALLALALLPGAPASDPRPPAVRDAAAIRLALDKLNVVGSALYVGAHPDDENTALLAWLANGRKVEAAYLSMTRGDGGQNLIGSDTGELLGVIRTQELLAARRIDGAQQFFTRALDFGFSKGPGETLEKWGKDRILADVVFVIRRYRPDVIIAGFGTAGGGGAHGHHTASALLAEEAFAAAADSTRFPEQLRWVRPWQAKRLVSNAGRIAAGSPDTIPGRVAVDLGAYNALLGRSYTELAGESRSMHKTQGFGAPERRGSLVVGFDPKAGVRATGDLFDGVNLTWSRVPEGAGLTAIFAQAAREFRSERPQAIVPLLLKAHAILARLPDDPRVVKKRAELLEVIRACTGLWLEATASRPWATPGGSFRVATSALNRSDVGMTLTEAPSPAATSDAGALGTGVPGAGAPGRPLASNVPVNDTIPGTVAPTAATTEPYWLSRRPLAGSFDVADPSLIGTPENAPASSMRFRIKVAGAPLEFTVPVVYRWVDPVMGERYRSFEIVPPVTMRFDQTAYLFADLTPRPVRVTVQSADVKVDGTLTLKLPAGWSSAPPSIPVRLAAGEADTSVRFMVTPGAGPAAGVIGADFEMGGTHFDRRLVRLDYPHIPIQTLLPPAEARLVRADLKIAGRAIGYLMGSGDQGPEALEQMGFAVTLLDDDDLANADLSRFDCVVAGVRAYNTRPRLRGLERRLLDYVSNGGRLVIQYCTADEGLKDRLGPYPFTISRDRVTVEEAAVEMKPPDHPLLAAPNRIGAADFEGWIQERGLYFANPFDPRYEAVLSCHDPGEPARDGGLLYARSGKGVFIYTGYGFFRQLPAGVPGAWRLFANLVSHTNGTPDGRPATGTR